MKSTILNQNEQSATDSVYVGRQAIFDRELDVVAYELLFRNGSENRAVFTDGDTATGQVLLNTFVEIGIEQVVGNRLAFINVGESFVLNGHCQALPREQVVLELLEDVVPHPELIKELRNLTKQGFHIALDDFIYKENLDELISLADLVKIDIQQLSQGQIEEHVATLGKFDVKLLAEKVETHEEYEFCKELGFAYFQGYFVSRPRVIEGRQIPTDRLSTMQLLARLRDPKVQINELEKLILQDPGLSFKLLRFLNSSFCGLRHQVDSIRQATALVGLSKMKTWASLLGFGSFKNKPRELIAMANVRARMCELLAIKSKSSDPDRYFTIGLFSLLDAFTDSSMQEILGQVPLSDETKDALLDYSGPMGNILKCVLAYEQGDWDTVNSWNSDSEYVGQAYLEAVEWTEKIMNDLKGMDP